MTECFTISTYAEGSPLHQSDQVTVSSRVWRTFYDDHDGSARPLFFQIGFSDTVCRLRPEASLRDTQCRVPEWAWLALGCPDGSEELPIIPRELPDAGTITLRARREATLTGSEDPVAMLTAALSGSGGDPSWAVLSTGAELPLACGVFDIMEIQSIEGYPVPAACILDVDVNLELVPALDAPRHQPRPPTPRPAEPEPFEEGLDSMIPLPSVTRSGGFVPFSGVGRRLGGP